MFRYIRKHQLFATLAAYSIRFKIFAQIRIQIFDLMQKNTFSHTGEYFPQNVRFEAKFANH
jgi:hypothetical protein